MASFTGAIFYICAYPRESFLKTDFGIFSNRARKSAENRPQNRFSSPIIMFNTPYKDPIIMKLST